MAYALVSRNMILNWIVLDPSFFFTRYNVVFPDQELGYTSGPDVPDGTIYRYWYYENIECYANGPTAAFIYHTSGGPIPTRDGFYSPPNPDISYYGGDHGVINTFRWTQQYSSPSGGQTTQGTDSDFFFLNNSGQDTPGEGANRSHYYYEGSGSINFPVFESEADWENWRDAVNDYLQNPLDPSKLFALREALWRSLNPVEVDPNTEDPSGPSKPGGGDGDHRKKFDPIPKPGLPTMGAAGAGFVYMLDLLQSEMELFAQDLLDPNIWQAIKAFFSDPMDFIVGIMLVPFIPTTGARVKPKFGTNVFQNSFKLVTNQYVEIDCGGIYLTKYYGSFLDYNPYTKLEIWLPYIGYRELNPDEVMGGTISVTYYCDALTGDCVCFVGVTGGGHSGLVSRVIAQYNGNCGVRVPFGRTSYDAAVQASISLLAGGLGLVTKAATGSDVSAAAGDAVAGATTAIINGMKVGAVRSGTAGASAGYMSIQKPHIIRTTPRQSLPDNYAALDGYPSNMYGPLYTASGFARVDTIKLEGIQATQSELEEIQSILSGGVYI